MRHRFLEKALLLFLSFASASCALIAPFEKLPEKDVPSDREQDLGGDEFSRDDPALDDSRPDEHVDLEVEPDAEVEVVEEELGPLCGDGNVDSGEECDDSKNGVEDDGCKDDCTFSCHENAECFNAEQCDGLETCAEVTGGKKCEAGTPRDDGFVCQETPRKICHEDVCETSTCGDGFVDSGANEDCEPPSASGCNASCHWACTGAEGDCPDDLNPCNGTESCNTTTHECQHQDPLDTGTECQESPRKVCVSNSCQLSTCGDGFVDGANGGTEECDDTNAVAGDGCEPVTCQFSCEVATQATDCDDSHACTSDTCNATTHVCEHATLGNETVCRAATLPCDIADVCDGTALDCPAIDVVQPDTFKCAVAGAELCDADDYCDGTTKTCTDRFQAAGYECRAAAPGGCDVAETCAGGTAACPVDGFRAAGYECRAAGANPACDPAETCAGGTALCPDNAYAAANTACTDGNDCSMVDVCNGSGVCAGTTTCVSGVTSPFHGPDTGSTNKRLGICITDADCDSSFGGDCTNTTGVFVPASWNLWSTYSEAMTFCAAGYWALTTAPMAPGEWCYRFYSGAFFDGGQSDACDGGCATADYCSVTF